jgi:mono/diheme cytochrome c family protein
VTDSPNTGTTEQKSTPRTRNMIAAGVILQLFLLTLGGVLYMSRNQPAPGHERLLVRDVLMPEELVFADTEVGITIGERTPPIEVAEVVRPTPEALSKGETLYTENCVSCHGVSAKGDGPSGAALKPPPRNLVRTDGWKRGTSLADIFTTVSIGLENTQMAGFDYLTPSERFNLTHYVMSLAVGHAHTTTVMLDSLDAQFSLSDGQQQPNIIPLSIAIDKMIGEAPAQPPEPDSAAIVELVQAQPRGAEIFADIVASTDREIAAYWLCNDSAWTTDTVRLRELVVAGTPDNGFHPKADLLSMGDWQNLRQYLRLRYQLD